MGILMDSIDFNECLKKKKELEKEAEQTSPLAPDVSRKHAKKSNRVERVLYIDDGLAWNADCVGAFNILRLYLKQKEIDLTFDAKSISHPYILKVAA